MQAFILAGGLGTRLRSVVKDRPKPMALINGKPFLEYQIGFLKTGGFTDIILSTGYLGEQIEEYFGAGKNHGVSIRYVKEKDLLGTGGAVKNAKDMLAKQFFILNGDSIFLVDFNAMLAFHKTSQADLTIALAKVTDKSRFGSVRIDKNFQIRGFFEKSNNPGNFINGGIYLIEKNNFNWKKFPEKFSLEKDFFPEVTTRNRIFGFVSDSYFIDIGTIDDYEKFNEQISNRIIEM